MGLVMKKLTQISVVVVAGIIALQGCATKNYGRLTDLSEYEQKTMNCREVELDLAKALAFLQYVYKESEFSSKDVLAILGDFGIGNSWEKKEATKSANTRIDALKALKSNKEC